MSGDRSKSGGVRLRWQLTISHLAVIALTLLSLVGAAVLGGVLFLRAESRRPPAVIAARIVAIVEPLLDRPGASAEELGAVLRTLDDGNLYLNPPALRGGMQPPLARGNLGASLFGLEYLLLVDRSGAIVASSAPARQQPGSRFVPSQPGWPAALESAFRNPNDQSALSVDGVGSNDLEIGLAPLGSGERALVVVRRPPEPLRPLQVLVIALTVFGLASVLLLVLSSVFAVLAAGALGYWLARRLARRLEGLAEVADGLAAGDLTRRADAGGADEIGQLAARFNSMAERLGESIAALAAERDRAEQSLQARRDLVANVSHELRTPLATIRAHLDSALDRHDSAHPADLRVLQREAERLSTLVDDLFSLARAEAGALPLVLEPLDLARVIQDTVESLAPIARRERRVTLVAQASGDLPLVRADRARVEQVLGNLLRNALHHTPPGGLVAVEALPATEGERIEVRVTDTGVGIPPEDLPHIFERFYRGGDPSRHRDGTSGAGLGLAIVRELIEAMGGRVEVESTRGEGTRFRFTLPLAVAEGARAPL